jgi:hypothetical protein
MTATLVRSVTFASGDLSLEGVVHLPDATPAPGVVVCHPHPLYGGDMENNVVLAACQALRERGFVALRFNFRGAGGSEGAFDEGRGERDDVRSALAHLRSLGEVDAKRTGIAGYSFGAMMAAEAAGGHLRALALISPPLQFSDLRVAWGCPALLVGGDMDALCPPDRLELAGQAPGAEVQVIEGADHSWWGSEDELAEVLGSFFAAHFR